MRRAAARVAAGLLVAVVTLLAVATPASAHPLGNFTVNSFDALRIQTGRVLVDHVTDRAEIPTQQLTFAADPIGKSSPAAAQRDWSARACRSLVRQLTLTVGGDRVPLIVDSDGLSFPAGAGGLPTSRLTCRLSTGRHLTIGDRTQVQFRDDSDNSRVGWHEIIAAGDGTTLASASVPDRSVSKALTAYPQDLLSSPRDVTAASLTAMRGGPRAADPLAGTDAPDAKEQRRGVDRLTVAFTDLVGRPELSIGVGLLAVVLALVLGAFHAFAPGHGKTVMAAYLVADRGNLRQVVMIGLAVTSTHTLGVLALGILLSTYASFAPESVYPWLGVASGLLLLGIGYSLARAAWQRRTFWGGVPLGDHTHAHEVLDLTAHEHPHDDEHGSHRHSQGHGHGHDHGHNHGHSHDDHDHLATRGHGRQHATAGRRSDVLVRAHPPRTAQPSDVAIIDSPDRPLVHRHGGRLHSHAPLDPDQPIRLRNLLSMGLAGGLVPSPSALIVLIGAIALHRAWFGVLLVVFYGAGMALTLVGIGLALSRLRGRFARRIAPGSRGATAVTVLPLVTSTGICLVGVFLLGRGLLQI